MEISKELIEKNRAKIIEKMKEADAKAYRFPTCKYRVYIDSDGDVDYEEWASNDNAFLSFRDTEYGRAYLHTFCHQFYDVLWDGWFTSLGDFAEEFSKKFGVKLESNPENCMEEDGENTILKNGLSVTNWYEWLEEQTEEAVNWFVSETDYEMILDYALEEVDY
jgi:hypothetical protein